MTVSTWKRAVSGNFSNAANWVGGVPILPSSGADLLVAGKPYTVTLSALDAVGELDIGVNATLALANAVMIVAATNGPVASLLNLGAIDIGAGSQLQVGNPMAGSSEIFNNGAINVDGAGSTFEVNAPLVELDGGGVVSLRDGAAITPFFGPDTLDNVSNTISGSGAIGNGDSLSLRNGKRGVIDANGAAALTLDTGSNAILNAGVIETTGAGGLLIESDLQQEGGLIAVGAGALRIEDAAVTGGGAIVIDKGASIVLDGASVTSGGAITIAAAGVVRTAAGASGELSGADIENAGAIRVVANSTLELSGPVYGAGKITVANGSLLVVADDWRNSGSININGASDPTGIDIDTGATWQLLGDGTVTLNGSDDSFISSLGAGATLDNNGDFITGAGQIGDSDMTINNNANGVIQANGGGLSISSAGGDSLYNAGAMSATSSGSLFVDSALVNYGRLIANSGGLIDVGGPVFGSGVAEIHGAGSIEFSNEVENDVVFRGKAAGTLILDNSTPSGADDPFFGSISGFASGKSTSDTLDLGDFTFNAGTMSLGSSTFGSLDANLVISNGVTSSGAIHLLGQYTSGEFHFADDGHGGTAITLART